MIYIVKCAWCGILLGVKKDARKSDEDHNPPISHGICRSCRLRLMEEINFFQMQKAGAGSGHSRPSMIRG